MQLLGHTSRLFLQLFRLLKEAFLQLFRYISPRQSRVFPKRSERQRAGSSEFLVEISTTEYPETPLAAQKAAMISTTENTETRIRGTPKSAQGAFPSVQWLNQPNRIYPHPPEGLFHAAFGVPRMRASVCSVVNNRSRCSH